MIDHVGLRTSDAADVQRLKKFYVEALKPLGYALLREFTAEDKIGYVGVGLGLDGKPDFWIGTTTDAGAKDNGAPGPRPQYHAGYYGAFVIDPAGNNLEACCHRPA